jgi:phosphatidate cytidylyltransferase
LKSDDGSFLDDEATGEVPVVSSSDSRVTITGADVAAEIAEPAPHDETALPHWTDAPTGQVPIVVAREAAESTDPWAAIPAPAWREGEADWVAHEEQFDASFLASETREDESRPWEFVLTEDVVVEEQILDETPRPEPPRAERTRRPANPLAGRAVRQSRAASVSQATTTGLLLGGLVGGLFLAGPVPVALLVLCALGFAAAEGYAGFRRAGAHPATLLGLVAVLTLGVASYERGLAATGAVTVLLVVFGFLWYANAERSIDVLDGIGATIFVYVWVGVLGSFALLMISPQYSVDRHGMAYLFGTVVLTVANDTGALFIGRWLGRHPLNARLSPNKTREGTIGGTLLTLAAGAIVLPMISPWTTRTAIEVAVAVAIVVPLGDLFESMLKRTLGVKDLGRLLPGHGGLLDRIDGLLFALPTVFYLTRVLHLG